MTAELVAHSADHGFATTAALERIATALEQLVLLYDERRTEEEHDLPAEPDYVKPMPPDLVSQPATAVVMGPVPYQRPQRPPANPNQQPGQPCPIHGWTWKYVPGGVSKKTGRPYDAFWACGVQGCTQRPA